MAEKKINVKQVNGGRWKYGVPSELRGKGYSPDYWSWSLRTYSSKSAALRAARNYFGSYQAIHNSK